jgi:hypothetical protein
MKAQEVLFSQVLGLAQKRGVTIIRRSIRKDVIMEPAINICWKCNEIEV